MTRRIVVGVDGTDTSFEALRWAVAEARTHGAIVEAVHVWQMPSHGRRDDVEAAAQTDLARAVALADVGGLSHPIVKKLRCGPVSEVLIDAARDADLVVLGRRPQARTKRLLKGSVSDSVARRARCPVVVVPSSPSGMTLSG